MDHEFELAFTLLDEAAGRIRNELYGITRIPLHDYDRILLSTVHHHTPQGGHHLVLTAHDDLGLMLTVEATTPDLDTTPTTRIRNVRAGGLTFKATDTDWTYQATDEAGTTHTIAAGIGDDPMWTVTIGDDDPITFADLNEAVAESLWAAA